MVEKIKTISGIILVMGKFMHGLMVRHPGQVKMIRLVGSREN